MRDKAKQLKPLLTDRNAISQCETEIRECQKYIDYFTEELAKVESRKDTIENTLTSSNISSSSSSSNPDHSNTTHDSTHADLNSVNDVSHRPSSSSTTEHRDIKKYSTLG